MTNFAPAHAGIAVCRRIVDAMPDAPIYAVDVEGWFATPGTDPEKPYVKLDANMTCVAVSIRPRAGVFAGNIGATQWVGYPDPTNVDSIGSDEYYGALRAAVELKLAEIAALAEVSR
jgi:hypothetical protein